MITSYWNPRATKGRAITDGMQIIAREEILHNGLASIGRMPCLRSRKNATLQITYQEATVEFILEMRTVATRSMSRGWKRAMWNCVHVDAGIEFRPTGNRRNQPLNVSAEQPSQAVNRIPSVMFPNDRLPVDQNHS